MAGNEKQGPRLQTTDIPIYPAWREFLLCSKFATRSFSTYTFPVVVVVPMDHLSTTDVHYNNKTACSKAYLRKLVSQYCFHRQFRQNSLIRYKKYQLLFSLYRKSYQNHQMKQNHYHTNEDEGLSFLQVQNS